MSYEPADAVGIEPCEAVRLARVQAGFLQPVGLRIQRGWRTSRAPALAGPPGSNRGCASAASPSTSGERRTRIPGGRPPSRLPSGAAPLAGSFSMIVRHSGYAEHHAESGRLERHGRSRALVSSEAQHPGWFTLPGTPGGICTLTPLPGHRFLRPARLHSATSAWSDRRDSNSRCDLGKVAC
jgi:hypothetical protein